MNEEKYLWVDAQGEDLPPIDKEVIVLTAVKSFDCSTIIGHQVSFGHRPNPDGWDAVSLTTEKKEHYYPKCYGKGGWNIPDVVYWLDLELPTINEESV